MNSLIGTYDCKIDAKGRLMLPSSMKKQLSAVLEGGLSNFDSVTKYFSLKGYKIIIPELPIYTMSLLKTNVKSFAKYLHDFIEFKNFKDVILLGNSLGGHIGLYHTKQFPEKVKALVITGSSGLYESAMGGGYTKRSDYEVIKKESSGCFLRS